MFSPLARCALAAAITAVTVVAEARCQTFDGSASVSSGSPARRLGPWRLFAPQQGRESRAEAVENKAANLQRVGVAARRAAPAGDRDEPLPLPPQRPKQRTGEDRPKPPSLASAVTSMMGGLAVVLGLLFAAVWLVRRAHPKSTAALPAEVVELLGWAPLSGRQQMHLVRFGAKLVLLSVTPTGAESLSEITDLDEVNRLTGVCRQNRQGSITSTFRQVLHQLGREPTRGGFAGHTAPSEGGLAGHSPPARSSNAATNA